MTVPIEQRRHYEVVRDGHARFAGSRAQWDQPAERYRLMDGVAGIMLSFRQRVVELARKGEHSYGQGGQSTQQVHEQSAEHHTYRRGG